MTEYPNWFNGYASNYFGTHLSRFADTKVNMLQVGAYTGNATVWLFENVLTHPGSTLTDIDTWEGSDEPEHKELNWKSVEEVYDSRTAEYVKTNKLIKVKSTSDEFFASIDANTKYDFIYIDGDHKAESVLKDGISATKHIAPGGYIAFDDYQWSLGKGPAYDPKPAIDAIWLCYSDRFEVLEMGLQVWIKNKG
jgi:predicted O-methyltransferase YrrM